MNTPNSIMPGPASVGPDGLPNRFTPKEENFSKSRSLLVDIIVEIIGLAIGVVFIYFIVKLYFWICSL